MRNILSLGLSVYALLSACSCGAPGGADATTPDAALLDTNLGPDAYECVVHPDTAPQLTWCDGGGERYCQSWAESRGPGLNVIGACSMFPQPHCERADGCTQRMVDGGYVSDCACGDGPPCDPGFVCARPFGSSEPWSCVCATGG